MSAILEDSGHKSGRDCSKNLDRIMATVSVLRWTPTSSNELMLPVIIPW